MSPGGRVVGIDVIPAQPPRGVSTIQGNFLSAEVQAEVRNYVTDQELGRSRWNRQHMEEEEDDGEVSEEMVDRETRYFERESNSLVGTSSENEKVGSGAEADDMKDKMSQKEKDEQEGRVVDVVLSDMSAPWEQTSGFYIRSFTEPYIRMINTSGMPFRDHAGSMVCSWTISVSESQLS